MGSGLDGPRKCPEGAGSFGRWRPGRRHGRPPDRVRGKRPRTGIRSRCRIGDRTPPWIGNRFLPRCGWSSPSGRRGLRPEIRIRRPEIGSRRHGSRDNGPKSVPKPLLTLKINLRMAGTSCRPRIAHAHEPPLKRGHADTDPEGASVAVVQDPISYRLRTGSQRFRNHAGPPTLHPERARLQASRVTVVVAFSGQILHAFGRVVGVGDGDPRRHRVLLCFFGSAST